MYEHHACTDSEQQDPVPMVRAGVACTDGEQ